MEQQEDSGRVITDGSEEVKFGPHPHPVRLNIVIKEPGDGASYVEAVHPDGTTRRLVTKPEGGEIRIRTE